MTGKAVPEHFHFQMCACVLWNYYTVKLQLLGLIPHNSAHQFQNVVKLSTIWMTVH